MDVWFCAGRDHAERHVMRAEMVDTGTRSQERAGEKCVFYLTETYMDVGHVHLFYWNLLHTAELSILIASDFLKANVRCSERTLLL